MLADQAVITSIEYVVNTSITVLCMAYFYFMDKRDLVTKILFRLSFPHSCSGVEIVD